MPHEYFGLGSVQNLSSALAAISPKSLLLIHGKNSYHSSGAQKKLTPLLRPNLVTSFSDFSSNAKLEEVEKGLEIFRAHHCDCTLAVGGGSALDLAKVITLLGDQGIDGDHLAGQLSETDHHHSAPASAAAYIRKEKPLTVRRTPLILIPTTAGTGSEATHFAVVYIGKDKYSLAHPSLIPDEAIIDPELTFSLPPYQTASTGMDALAQAIESYWSVHSTEESKQYAREAIVLALQHLEKAVNNPTPEARTGMAKAANLAGKAINISFTTACHAISYPITSYFGIPHGHAVALTLPEMVLYNSGIAELECLDKRGVGYVQQVMADLYSLFIVSSAEEMKLKLEGLLDAIGLKRKLSAVGIATTLDLEIIIQHGFNPERVKNNPRKIGAEELRKVLDSIR